MKKTAKKSYRRNIFLAYIIASLDHAFLWIAIWVLFYLRITDYAGIGLIEAAMIATVVFGEMPTGAFADLVGKKTTLALAFLFGAVGNVVMGSASSLMVLISGVMIATVGGALSSGSFEALIYDSLLSLKKEKEYDQVLTNISTLRLVSYAISSIVGAWLYTVSPGLPFFGFAMIKLISFVLVYFLKEPEIDSETFSLRSYVSQTKQGLKQLFKSHIVGFTSVFLIILASIIIINDEVLNDVQLVALGWTENELGWLVAMIMIAAALITQLPKILGKYVSRSKILVSSVITIAATMIVVPLGGMVAGAILIALRWGMMETFSNASSAVINSNTLSKFRATTLSTYNMLFSLPYILFAYVLGSLMDRWSVFVIARSLGSMLIAVSILFVMYMAFNAQFFNKKVKATTIS